MKFCFRMNSRKCMPELGKCAGSLNFKNPNLLMQFRHEPWDGALSEADTVNSQQGDLESFQTAWILRELTLWNYTRLMENCTYIHVKTRCSWSVGLGDFLAWSRIVISCHPIVILHMWSYRSQSVMGLIWLILINTNDIWTILITFLQHHQHFSWSISSSLLHHQLLDYQVWLKCKQSLKHL